MLLQRLVEYADTDSDVVPPFYARKAVRWILDIAEDGTPNGGLTDTAEKSDPVRKFGTLRLVPNITRTVGVAPALAVDNAAYVFGWPSETSKPDRVAKQHETFRALIDEWILAEPDGAGRAIAAFYKDGHYRQFEPPTGWNGADLIGFRVAGKHAAETPEAQRFWAGVASDRKNSGQTGRCLVCGEIRPLLKTIPQQIPQRWLPGATQGASLVSVNESVHGYELQKFLDHTPICAGCGLKFMTSLTSLLSDPMHSTALSGQNARLAWWVLGGSTFDPWDMADQPDAAKVQQLIAGAMAGSADPIDGLSTYCSVTVGGNVARVVVRDWVELPLNTIQANLAAWFCDYEMVDHWTGEVVYPRITQLARVAGRWQTGRNGAPGSWMKFGAKGEHRPANVLRDLRGAALLGRPLPPSLLSHVINRICADGRLDAARAGLIRLALRRNPYLTATDRERLTPTLNMDNRNPAYVSGRIFAVMDDLQKAVSRAADQKLNTTFAERYFSRAVHNPQVVLVSGRRTATAWLKRLRGPLHRPHWSDAYERRMDDLFSQLDAIPSGGLLNDKAQFILGYHQQRAEMRTERIAAAADKKKTDLPLVPDDEVPASDEGDEK
jgi:CRISPR-associated protein Csd1